MDNSIQEETIEAGKKHMPASVIVRNIFAGVTAVLFIISFFLHEHHLLVRGIAYLFGAAAYFAELVDITSGFHQKKSFSDIFMAACFGGLYVFLAVSYVLEHYNQ